MGLLDFLEKRLEEKKNEVIKNLQDKRDEFLKKVPLLDYEQHLQEEAEREAKAAERKAQQEAERKAKEEAERKAKEAKEEAERKAREEKAEDIYYQMSRYNALQDLKCPNCGHVFEWNDLDNNEFTHALGNEKCPKCGHKLSVDYYDRLCTNSFIKHEKIEEEKKRKAKEEAERKAREEQLKAKEEAERKAKEEAAKAKEEEEHKLQELIPKAENGDAQAACQLGMWFQHGENGITKNIDKAIYWYQKAAMHGNQAALTFLNMALEEKKSNEKIEAEEKIKRAQYDTEDEYLANEKNDANAADRYGAEISQKAVKEYDSKNYDSAIKLWEKAIHYRQMALRFGHPDIDSINENIKVCEKNIKYAQCIIDTKQLGKDMLADIDKIFENDKRQREMRSATMVDVTFSADFYYEDWAGKHERSDTWNREITTEEYNSLLRGGSDAVANYIRSNLLDTRVFPKDSVITRATMAKR